MQKPKLTAVAAVILMLSVVSPQLAIATDGEVGGGIAAAATTAVGVLQGVWANLQVAATNTAAALGVAATEQAGAAIIASDYERTNEQTAAITGAINASMKVGAIATTDALNAHKNTIIMAMAASDKARIVAEHSLVTLPAASQTGKAALVAGQGIEGAEKVSSYANIALAKRHMTQKSSSGTVSDSYQKYLKFYNEKDGTMPNADILADSLLAGAKRPGAVESKTFTKAQIEAAQDYIANIVDVSPPPDIPDSAANSVEGRRFRMLLRAEKARMGLAFKSFGDALAFRTPIPGFNSGAELGIAGSTGDISYAEFLTNEIRRRYNNPQWYAQVAGATPANLNRESVFMQALDLHVLSERNRRLEKLELLLAQMSMNQVATGPLRQQIEVQRSMVKH